MRISGHLAPEGDAMTRGGSKHSVELDSGLEVWRSCGFREMGTRMAQRYVLVVLWLPGWDDGSQVDPLSAKQVVLYRGEESLREPRSMWKIARLRGTRSKTSHI